MECPRCSRLSQSDIECSHCGIIFEKFLVPKSERREHSYKESHKRNVGNTESPVGTVAQSKSDELLKLADLMEKDLINQDEYNRLKSEIVDNKPTKHSPKPDPEEKKTPSGPKSIGYLYHPVNKYPVEIFAGFSWPCLFFGGFWYLYKRIWLWAFISLVAGFFTYGLALFVFPFFANKQHQDCLLKQGYLTENEN